MRRPHLALLAALLLTLGVAVLAPGTGWALPAVPNVVGGSAHRIHADQIVRELTPRGGIKTAMSGGNTVEAAVREAKPRADGYRHIDTPALIDKLKVEGLNTYTYGVWDMPTDWDDLSNEFAPAAERAGIKIWVYLVPPSECFYHPTPVFNGRCSNPFREDYIAWAKAIAELSVKYSSVVAWGIDDFELGSNAQLFTPAYMQQIADTQDAINPHLGLFTCAYYGQATDPNFYSTYAPYIDGIIYPYMGGSDNDNLDASVVSSKLDDILHFTQPTGLGVVMLNYTNRSLGSMVSPTAGYVAKVVQATMPYIADGKVMGINLYGLPLPAKPLVETENRAAHGSGRLSFSITTSTAAGQYAQAQQQVSVDPNAGKYVLKFSDYDQYSPDVSLPGYHFKQVLVDGNVVWSSDVADPGGETYQQRTVDLTDALRGKTSATLALRLYENQGVGSYPIDVGIDDVSGSGFTVRDGGFEQRAPWQLSGNSAQVRPAIDLAGDHDPSNILAAAAAALSGRAVDSANPDVTTAATDAADVTSDASSYQSDHDAMYGAGRLSLSVQPATTTPAGACATASQVVQVDPASPRYELSFWDYVRHAAASDYGGRLQMSATIDGQQVWVADPLTYYPYLWVNDDTERGSIDVSDFVRGKDQVTLAFNLCETQNTGNLGLDVGFDHVETIGLAVRNADFEQAGDWRTSASDHTMAAEVKITR